MAAHFLGLELATDQLRACILDEKQELVGVERVDFDTELSEYQTQGGIFTTPGEAYTTPVEMWVKALGMHQSILHQKNHHQRKQIVLFTCTDILLAKLASSYKIKDIKAISGCAQQALVWWKSTPLPALSSLDPGLPLPAHFPAASFSLPHTPTSQDNSSHPHALAIESTLGGADAMARRVGISAGGNASMLAAQMFRVREMWAKEVWVRTGRVQVASKFLESLVGGKWAGIGEAEACLSGMWNVQSGVWDEGVLDIVGGSREEGRRVRGWLGDVDVNGGGRKAGYVSRYLVDRYGFDPGILIRVIMQRNMLIFPSSRNHSHSLHIRHVVHLCFCLSCPVGRRSVFWSNGYIYGSSAYVYPLTDIQHRSSPVPRTWRQEKVYCYVEQSVSMLRTRFVQP